MSTQYEWITSGNVLAGFTGKRGNPWWFRPGKGMEPFLFDGPVPMDSVKRLLGFEIVNRPVMVEYNGGISEVPGQVAWMRGDDADSDTPTVFGIHSAKYRGHGYNEWLIKNVMSVVGGAADVANAGLLNRGAVAFVQIERPESVEITGAGGPTTKIRPFIMATTSFDASVATTYKAGWVNVVCDNTHVAFLMDGLESYRVKNTANSEFDTLKAADVVGTLDLIAESTAREIERWSAIDVSDKAWGAFVEAAAPVTDDKGQPLSPRSISLAESKREALTGLWRTDIRVQPWSGTAWGVVQAVNTYRQHMSIVRGMSREERTITRAVQNTIGAADTEALRLLGTVLNRDLITA